MTKPKDRWTLFIRSRIVETESALHRLHYIMEQLRSIPSPWGSAKDYSPNIKTLIRDKYGIVGITRLFGPGIYQAMVSFSPRVNVTDTRESDDVLMIDFNPRSISMELLCQDIIPKYIAILNAYCVECFDEKFVELAYKTPLAERVSVDERWQVSTVYNISYFDELLCKRAFDLTVNEAITRLSGRVDCVRELRKGLYIVGRVNALEFEESRVISEILTKTLLRS